MQSKSWKDPSHFLFLKTAQGKVFNELSSLYCIYYIELLSSIGPLTVSGMYLSLYHVKSGTFNDLTLNAIL